MDIKIIKTQEEYQEALDEIERSLLDTPDPNSPEGRLLEVLIKLVEDYEEESFPISLPDPVEYLKYYMDSRGLKQKDLAPFIGSTGRVSEVLTGKRKLTKDMAFRLYQGLDIPFPILYQPFREKPGISLMEMFMSSFESLKVVLGNQLFPKRDTPPSASLARFDGIDTYNVWVLIDNKTSGTATYRVSAPVEEYNVFTPDDCAELVDKPPFCVTAVSG